MAVLRTVHSIVEDAKYALNDTSGVIWSGADYARAYNRAVDAIGDRMRTTAVYTMPTGWSDSELEYTLPAYVAQYPGSVRPQFRRNLGPSDVELVSSDMDPWCDFASYDIEPTVDGDYTLRFYAPPPATEGRILYSTRPGRIPYNGNNFYGTTTDPWASTDTGFTVEVAAGGDYFAPLLFLVDFEWVAITAIERPSVVAASFIVNNAIRGYGGTTATTHIVASKLYWGIQFERTTDANTLMDAIMAECHRQKLGVVSSADSQYHQQMVTYLDARVEKALRGRSRQDSPRMLIDPSFTFWS